MIMFIWSTKRTSQYVEGSNILISVMKFLFTLFPTLLLIHYLMSDYSYY